jgi:hypothetical protein
MMSPVNWVIQEYKSEIPEGPGIFCEQLGGRSLQMSPCLPRV